MDLNRSDGRCWWNAVALWMVALVAAAACSPVDAVADREARAQAAEAGAEFGIVVHGGAGTIRREDVTPEREAEYHQALEEALRAGYEILEGGGSALDAVEAAVVSMEDFPRFNAGKGAVFTSEGNNELDAAIMDGRTGNAGAVAGLRRVRNPVRLARLVMERSTHVFLVGEGAESFGRQHGIEEVDPSYFHTDERWDALQRHLETRREETGTVGAVALDRQGHLAAATSTGGLTGKRFGRVGDVPVIGAGTYASDESCAVSGTGQGEYFIRNVVAHDICARLQYTGASLQEAAHEVVMGRLVEQEADGGVIGIDGQGRITSTFNTPGMYRGHMLAGAEPVTAIFQDE